MWKKKQVIKLANCLLQDLHTNSCVQLNTATNAFLSRGGHVRANAHGFTPLAVAQNTHRGGANGDSVAC
ncbi:hypothetical protein WJX79_010105 [Trebouxia sp. C0005]